MRLRFVYHVGRVRRYCRETLLSAIENRDGNFALTFALLMVPLILAMGVGIDYTRAYNTQSKMQSDLDAALVAAIREVDGLNEDALKSKVADWFTMQADTSDSSYTLDAAAITISKTNKTIKAVVTGTVPTTFMGLANLKSMNVAATSSVVGPSTLHLNVYLVLDKSASMLLAATTADQATMKNSKGGCVFACHTAEGGPFKYKGVDYGTHYALAKAMGVTLRADISVTAAKEVLTMIASSDPTQARIKVGLYTIGSKATQVLAPTYSTSTAKTTLDTNAKGLNSATSEATTDFNTSLAQLTTMVGTAGDGSSASSPLKLVLLLTDGVQSQRPWVVNNPSNVWQCVSTVSGNCVKFNNYYFPDQTKVSPLNPGWCKAIKTAKATVGVLYTEYLSIDYDWGYNGTVGDTMKTSSYTTLYGGTMRTGVFNTISRRAYIPYALEDCATSPSMFLSASNPTEIEKGLSSLFKQYLGSVRLTQ